jgi:ribokinase
VVGGHFFRAFGGKGANQAVASARAGAETAFISKVGDDSFGTEMMSNFEKDRICIEGVGICKNAASGVALILVDEKGENLISVAPEANGLLTPDDINANAHLISEADVILLQLEIPLETVYTAIEIAKEAGVRIILNPAPMPKQGFSEKHLEMVDYCIPNSIELSMLSNSKTDSEESIQKAAVSIRDKGVGTVVVTLGSSGVFYIDDSGEGTVPAKEATPVDTVGAGDCFSGCFACALSEGSELKKAVEFAVGGAALSVTKMGAQPSMPMRTDIMNI